jgi:ABC-type multidrug transport system ATPase subunit
MYIIFLVTGNGTLILCVTTYISLCKGLTLLQMFVEDVMELLELTSLQNTLVGLPGVSGLSSEQRKRLTIAVELVKNRTLTLIEREDDTRS